MMPGAGRAAAVLGGGGALVIALGSLMALSAQDAPRAPVRVALVGGTVIDGTGGAPLADATVLLEGERIQAVGRRRDVAVPPGTRSIDVTGKWVLPGFIELHAHLTLPQYGMNADNTEATRALRALHYMDLYLRSGITAVLDVGGMPEAYQALMRGQREGSVTNPVRLFPVGRIITSTGGHGGQMPGMARQADGPWDFRLAVRENFKAGFRHIKLTPTFTPEEIAAAVDEAKILGMRVTVHGGGVHDTWPVTSMTRIAVEAGAHSIQHLNQMDDDVLDLMAAKRVHLVPTLTVLRALYRSGTIPRVLVEPRGWTVSMHEDLFRKARQRGIVMGIGTDGVGRITPGYPDLFPGIGHAPGWYFDEMKYFVELGASRMETIVAATKNGAVILGEESRLGTLAPGKLADLQVLRGNPLESFDALGNPELVMVGGKQYTFSSPEESPHSPTRSAHPPGGSDGCERR